MVVVNPMDSTRLDLVIPGEQHMYLRAATSQERQQWLVALGSAKACVHKRTRNDTSKWKIPNYIAFTEQMELSIFCDFSSALS
mgnify:CR=1 FL=1